MKRVGLLIDRDAGMSSSILEGIGEYMGLNRNWIVHRKEAQVIHIESVKAFQPDGIIAAVLEPNLEEALQTLSLPRVSVIPQTAEAARPLIMPEPVQVMTLQLSHLLSRGHRHVAWVGFSSRWFDNELLKSGRVFCRNQKIRLSELDLDTFWGRAKNSAETDQALREWLREQHLPLGIFCGRAEDAERVAQRCHEAQLDIPEQVSIVTLNDDRISHALAFPPFSTVDIPWRQLGIQAAQTLDRMMNGDACPQEITCIQPTGLTERRSTESIALTDENLAKAVAYIRQHEAEKILVDDVARASGMSRRLLEDRFHRNLGHSPFREIRHHQVQHVRKLLVDTDLSLEQICDRSAFAFLSHMSKAFRQEYGTSPGRFRKYAKGSEAEAEISP